MFLVANVVPDTLDMKISKGDLLPEYGFINSNIKNKK
jgi:hypothetical protein